VGRPQQPELARSGRTDVDPGHDATTAEVRHRAPDVEEGPQKVPEANQPGHRDESPPDQPDLDAFAEKLGMTEGGRDTLDRIEPDLIAAGKAVAAALAIPPLKLAARGLDAAVRWLERRQDR
jgi:hypothetical protein